MINEERTFKEFGYTSEFLTYGSNKKVWAICDNCKEERLLLFFNYTNLCRSCSHIGNKLSEETKIKISKSTSGKNSYLFGKTGKDHPWFGKHHSEEHKQKMRELFLGKNSPVWNFNKTDEERLNDRSYPEYKEWRILIYKRDEYTCQICGQVNGELRAHHLDGYANNYDKRILLENGITLCKECHDDFHHQFGNRNNTKKQYNKFKEGNK